MSKKSSTKNQNAQFEFIENNEIKLEKEFYNKKTARDKNLYKKINIVSFFLVIFSLFILNILFSNKTGISQKENRELAVKPTLSKLSYADGSYFKDYEAYFTDRFAFRDSFMSFSDTLMGFKGYSSDGIEIINTNASLIDNVDLTKKDENNAKDDNVIRNIEEAENDNGSIEISEKNSNSQDFHDIEKEQMNEIDKRFDEIKKEKELELKKVEEKKQENKINTAGQFIIVNNIGYEIFTYNEYFMSFYYDAVNYYADKLSENRLNEDNSNAYEATRDVKIYSILAPTSIEFNLPEKYASLTDSQKDGIEYVNEKLRENVIKVDVYSNLEKYKDEYLYFKTDHHWTALGAYRAYEAFIMQKGEIPISIDKYEKIKSNEKYLGSIYNMTSNKKLEKNKDDIWYYDVDEPIIYEIHDSDNNISSGKSVFYPRYFNRERKYAVFMGGDVPFSKITTNHSSKKKVMIIKDSYANAFIPFLIPHYSEIYIADPRNCNYNVLDLIEENEIDELVFVNYAMVLKLGGFSEMMKNLAIQKTIE